MVPAKLIELSLENKIHDLTSLLSSGKSEITIGRRDYTPGTKQADILLGEDEKGEPNAAVFFIKGISRRQGMIGYDSKENSYYIKDCSTHGTTRMNDELLNKGERRNLENGVKLFFGIWKYGPVTFLQEI